eukprot:SM000011S19107  [mRNA]  locus=s11:904127:906648:- [translate_table: standard]
MLRGGGGPGDGIAAMDNQQLVDRLVETLASDAIVAADVATGLISRIDQQGRAAILAALYSSASDNADLHFLEADTNKDGVLDQKEFSSYVEAQAIKYGASEKPLTEKQLLHLTLRAAIGMIGFGFTDNAIMIIAGDAIQNSIGATLNLPTLLSAGLGNAIADLVGTAFREYIEGVSSNFMPSSRVSPVQMQMKEAWWAETTGASVGVTIGCLLGLVPILFIKTGVSGEPVVTIASALDTIGEKAGQVCTQEVDKARHLQLEWHRSSPTTTVFASVSEAFSQPRQRIMTTSERLGGLVLLATVSVAMGLRRIFFTRQRQQ